MDAWLTEQGMATIDGIWQKETPGLMSGPSVEGMGAQRGVFSELTDDSFEWRSELSQDGGKTWITVMRVSATRLLS